MKRFIVLVLLVCCLLGLGVSNALAVSPSTDEILLADALYEFGLFKGTGTNAQGAPIYSLDEKPTRQQAVVMLVRMLGKEEAALNCTDSHPFTDVDVWADRYIAYAYANGLTNGISETTFGGSQNINAQQYITLLLRSLGYDDSKGDFTFKNALSFSDSIGLTEKKYSLGNTFLRGDIVWLSCGALFQPIKDSGVHLVKQLNIDGVIPTEQYINGLILVVKADYWDDYRYIEVRDQSGEYNHFVDIHDLYTIAGLGEHQGYWKLRGYWEEDIYPIYFRIYSMGEESYTIDWRLVTTSTGNKIRYQSYYNGIVDVLTNRYYNLQNNFVSPDFSVPDIYEVLVSHLAEGDDAPVPPDSNNSEVPGESAEPESTPVPEWITSYELKDISGFSDTWMGEEVWLIKYLWDEGGRQIKYVLTGTPTSKLEKGVTYYCQCNGDTIRVRYNSEGYGGTFLFNYADLVAAGIL